MDFRHPITVWFPNSLDFMSSNFRHFLFLFIYNKCKGLIVVVSKIIFWVLAKKKMTIINSLTLLVEFSNGAQIKPGKVAVLDENFALGQVRWKVN